MTTSLKAELAIWRVCVSLTTPGGFASLSSSSCNRQWVFPVSMPALQSSGSGWNPLTPSPFSKFMIEPQRTLVASSLTSTDSRAGVGHALDMINPAVPEQPVPLHALELPKILKRLHPPLLKIPFVSLTALKDCLPWLQNYGCHF